LPSPIHALVFTGFTPYFPDLSNGKSRDPQNEKKRATRIAARHHPECGAK
jgi:hypothetical protein